MKTIRNKKLAVEIAGSGEPVVLIHGLGGIFGSVYVDSRVAGPNIPDGSVVQAVNFNEDTVQISNAVQVNG